jgi:hypothetical protein
MWQTKYASAVPIDLGLGFDFRPCSEGFFLTGRLFSVFFADQIQIDYIFDYGFYRCLRLLQLGNIAKIRLRLSK